MFLCLLSSVLVQERGSFELMARCFSTIFFAETSDTFPTYQCLQKGVWDFFILSIDLELFAKIKKDLVSTHSFLTFLLITQDLNKIKKSRTPFCRHC